MAEEQKTVETSPETQTEDPIISLKAELDKERQIWTEERKKLQKIATEAQQDASEATRFLKTVLPKINELTEKKGKTFVENWEDSPEEAVENKIRQSVAPLDEDKKRLEHKMAIISLRQKYPDFSKYEDKIKELSFLNEEFAAYSWTENGLTTLYKMAKFDDLEKLAKEKASAEVETKSRAVLESSSGNGDTPQGGKKALSPQEKRMMKQLGLTEEAFLKYRNYGVENAEV